MTQPHAQDHPTAPRWCDLHAHSTASDGTDTPAELARAAAEAGLGALALTDHDTTAGLPECARACETLGINFVPGIEVSADPGAVSNSPADPHTPRRGTLHILGLFIRHDDPRLQTIHQRMCDARNERNPAIVERLNALGLDIAYEEIELLARAQGTAVIGRPHIAQLLVERRYVRTIGEAFEKYLSRSGAAYVRRDRLDPRDAIDAIHHAGGLAILAHPTQLKLDNAAVQPFIASLKALGLDGIESRHSDHTPQQVFAFESLAHDLDLLTSGGSDYHGRRKPIALGSQRVPIEVYERLAKAAEGRA